MALKTIKNRAIRMIKDASSSEVVPSLIAGLSIAIAVVKLLDAFNHFGAIKAGVRKAGFTMENER